MPAMPAMPTKTFAPHALKAHYEAQLEAASENGGDTHHGGRTFRAMLKACRNLPARRLRAENAWLWSDLHLGHDNILRYANRPFADAEQMNARLYANWQATVGADDTLIFVGDMAMRGAVGPHTWQHVREAAGQHKCLVVGNHDLTGSGELRVDGFDDICAVLCIDGDPPLLCTHMPLKEVPAGCVNVHGHTHDEPPRASPHINVSVEQLDYRPIALTHIRALAREVVAGRFPAGDTTLQRVVNMHGGGRSGAF